MTSSGIYNRSDIVGKKMTPRRPSAATTRLLPFHSILLAILSCLAIALFLIINGSGDNQHQQQERQQQQQQQQRHSTPSIFGETSSASAVSNNNNEPDFSSSNMKSSYSGRNMVGGYSSSMDIDTISKNSELIDIANFAFHEYMTSPSSPALASAQTTTTGDSSSSSSSSFVMATTEEVEGKRVQIKVLEAQTQVVAGLNYKLTLAIVEGGGDTTSNNSSNNILCRGFIRGITIYKPLPHTGLGLSVSSWGKPMDCNSADKELLDLLHDATMMDEDDEDDGKENALVVEDALEEEWEEVEPDT